MQITLIRHSQTAGNAANCYIGRTDEPITEAGVALAKAKPIDPHVTTVYVTPLQRTQQTAAILFPNARQIITDGLREMDFGDFEGHNFHDMENNAAYRTWVDGNCQGPCPNGESMESFGLRVCEAFGKLVSQCAARGETDVKLVVHGGTIMALMSVFAEPKKAYYDWSVKNCQGFRCQLSFDPLTLTNPEPWGL